MSFRQLGRINYPGLDNYTIKGTGLDTGQLYWENAIKEAMNSRQSVGVIYGGAVTFVSAMTVKIAKGFCLFSNNQVVAWDDQNVTLTAANATNPRYDRIELAYSLGNNTADVDNDLNPVTLDKIHVATASALVGTAAGSPTAPVRTAGRLSLALIHVAALQVVLSAPDISQTLDTAFDASYLILSDAPYGIRYNATLGILQVTSDGATWSALLGTIPDDIVTTVKILNLNVTAAKLAADAVTTAKMLDANVTFAKLAASNTFVTASSGSFSSVAPSSVAVTNFSQAITCVAGSFVKIEFLPVAGGASPHFSNSSGTYVVELWRDTGSGAAQINAVNIAPGAVASVFPPGAFSFEDLSPAVGVNTYSIKVSSAGTVQFFDSKMRVTEKK